MISIDYLHWYNGAPFNGEATNWSVWLFVLISKSDMVNRAKLATLWPDHVELFEELEEREHPDIPTPITHDWIVQKMEQLGIHNA